MTDKNDNNKKEPTRLQKAWFWVEYITVIAGSMSAIGTFILFLTGIIGGWL